MQSRRVAFISDLHGNLVALDAVLAQLDALAVDEILCLGDIIDLGPQPQEVVDRLRQRNIRCVRGNHDPLDEHPTHPVLADIEAWTRERLDPATLAELDALPNQLVVDLAGTNLLCVHGSPDAVTDQLLDTTPVATLERWAAAAEFDALVCGHTHVQVLRCLDGRMFINVGSLGMPFARPFCGDTPEVLPWAEYAILTAGGGSVAVELRRTRYDIAAFARSLKVAGFPYADRWLDNWRIRFEP